MHILKVTQTSGKTEAGTGGNLSARETQVLLLLAEGLLIKEIADFHGLGFVTVRSYLSRIYRKLGVHSRAQAVACYIKAHPGTHQAPAGGLIFQNPAFRQANFQTFS